MAEKKQPNTMTVTEFARLGGLARSRSMTREQRCEIARKAVRAKLTRKIEPAKTKAILRRVAELRQRGWTFAEIGKAVGVTRQRAMELQRLAWEQGFCSQTTER